MSDDMTIPHPWRTLREMRGVILAWRDDLPEYLLGATDGERIWLRSDMGQVERRCVLAHELEHVRRRHTECQPPAVEHRVEHHAARWLLPEPRIIGEALAWSAGSLDEAADVLWVTPRTLRARLDVRHLHPAERAIIISRMERIETWA